MIKGIDLEFYKYPEGVFIITLLAMLVGTIIAHLIIEWYENKLR